MPTQKSSGDLITLIGSELADNNAGLISAFDVRHNIEDAVFSGPFIMATSDTENDYYFRNNVLVSGSTASDGNVIVENGVRFPNAPNNPDLVLNTQTEPYPGAGNISHSDLKDLSNDDHTIYLHVNGSRSMQGNFWTYQTGVDPHWIGPSGNDDEGIQFDYDEDEIPVMNINARPVYADGSTHQDINGSGTAKGVAKAWCNFDASGIAQTPVVRSSYNIDSLERIQEGVIKITFASGIFADNNYVAIGHSNANTGSGTFDTFDINTVGLMLREGDDANSLRSIHFVIRKDNNDLVDGEINDFVAYGLGPDTIPDTTPTVS